MRRDTLSRRAFLLTICVLLIVLAVPWRHGEGGRPGEIGAGDGSEGRSPGEIGAPAKPNPPVLPFVPGSWTIVILPDIQNYATHYPGLLRLQTQWILDHKDERDRLRAAKRRHDQPQQHEWNGRGTTALSDARHRRALRDCAGQP